jgi:hypothetical protein
MEKTIAPARAVIFAALIASTCGISSASAAAAAPACDRACLAGLITQYVDAVVAHDPSGLPLAPGAKITEDSKSAKLGEGLWRSSTGKGTFRQDYLDVRRQVAASHVVIQEGESLALCSVLLHVKDSKIAGIETLVQRVAPGARMKPTELGKPIRGMNDPIPAGKKQSRESMIRTALTYTEGLRVGSFIDGGTPFAPETYRVENGAILAGDGCGREDCGMYSQNLMVHPSIIGNVAAVDEENGIVLLWMNFGYTNSYGEGSSLVTFEAFKVWGGQIHSINAFFRTMPVGTGRFWPSSDPVPK